MEENIVNVPPLVNANPFSSPFPSLFGSLSPNNKNLPSFPIYVKVFSKKSPVFLINREKNSPPTEFLFFKTSKISQITQIP